MTTPTEGAVFNGDHLSALRQSLCSFCDQAIALKVDIGTRRGLEESVRILEAWLETHFKAHMNPETTAPDIWGTHAWEKMQKQLSELSGKIKKIQSILDSVPKPEESSEHIEPKSLYRRDLRRSVPGLHRSLVMFANFPEISYRMKHPKLSPVSPALEDAIQARRGAYILYHAIQTNEIRCELNIDLFSSDPASAINFGEPLLESDLHRRVCYQLMVKDPDRSVLRFQDVVFRKVVSKMAGVKTHEDATCLFGPLQSNSVHTHRIQRGPFDPQTYFHVSSSVGHTSTVLPLSNYMMRCPDSVEWRDWQRSKLLLAFQLSECALNLLGTPFLAHLSVENIFVHTSNTDTIFTLAVPTLATEELSRQDPHSLLLSNQLLNLGMIMIQMALHPLHTYSTTAGPDDKYGYAAEILSYVWRNTSGYDTWHMVCAFCVEEWKLKDEFSKPDKWDGVEESGWNGWLRNFLRVYDDVVVEGYVTKAFHHPWLMQVHSLSCRY